VTTERSTSNPHTSYPIQLNTITGRDARCACLAWRFSHHRWCKHLERASQRFGCLAPARRKARKTARQLAA
jgi:hypothetical protein